MPSRPTVNVASIVDLPSVLQSMAGSRRSGVLVVRHGEAERRIHLAVGQIAAVSGGGQALFARALCWTRAVTPAAVAEALRALGGDPPADRLAEHLRARGELQGDTVLEALALCAEEELAAMLGWPAPSIDIVADPPADAWAAFQRSCGLALTASALLLEGLRRQDERASLGELEPQPWDVLRAEQSSAAVADDDQRLILERCAQPAAFRSLLAHPLMQPHRATRAVVELRRAGHLRVVTASELAVLGEQAREQGRIQDAYGILGRSVALGHDGARVRELLANLAEQLGDRRAAAEHCLAAVPHLPSQSLMIRALRHALRLGADPEGPLTQLVALQLAAGEQAGALEAVLALAKLHENRGDRARAIEALGEAQQLGADKVATGLALARLAAAEGDAAQAGLQYEQAARLAGEQRRTDEAIDAWQGLMALRPDRLEPARACAELLHAAGRGAEAVAALRAALGRAANAPAEAQFAAWELLAKLAPDDGTAHDWLAKAYAKRRDRDGATRQLRMLADRQEHDGDDAGLIETLERIVVLGGEDVALLNRLGDAHDRVGRGPAAVDAWSRAADLAIETGKLDEAQGILAHALANVPASAALRSRAAEAALRGGDREAGLAELRRALDLAAGSGDLAQANELAARLCSLKPDDLPARLRLADLLHEAGDEGELAAVEDAARLAARRADFGTAVELARRRVHLAPAARGFRARAELVELLRRAGDAAGERAAARELLDTLLEAGEVERAMELLQRQFAAHPRDADIAVQLAEVSAGTGDDRLAARCYRHAVQLLQAEGRAEDAKAALEQLAQLSDDDLLIAAARRRLAAGEPIEWEQLRAALEHDQRQGMVEQLGSGRVKR